MYVILVHEYTGPINWSLVNIKYKLKKEISYLYAVVCLFEVC